MMSKKRDNEIIKLIIIGLVLFFLFGANCVQTSPPLAVAGGVNGGSNGGGISGGGATPPPEEPSGDSMNFINFCAIIPSLCSPDPADDSGTDGTTQDPCVLNPNMIGCTSPPAAIQPIGRNFFPATCSGISYGLPVEVTHNAWGDNYASFECSGNRECADHPPSSYLGRPEYLVCCRGECWDTP
jgi:hypothetical protein